MIASMKLYEHTEALRLVETWIDENEEEIRANGGALPDELVQLLDSAQMGFKDKAERVGLMVLDFSNTAKSIDIEIKRLQARKAHFEKSAAGLKEYLRWQLSAAGEKKIKGSLVTMWRQESAPFVRGELDTETLQLVAENDPELVIVEDIPATTTYTLNKVAVLARHAELSRVQEAVGAGQAPTESPEVLPPGVTVERTEFLRIQ